MALFEEER